MKGYFFSEAGSRPYNHDYACSFASKNGFVVCTCDGVGDDPHSGAFAQHVGEHVFRIAKFLLREKEGKRMRLLKRRVTEFAMKAKGGGSGQTTLVIMLGDDPTTRRGACHWLTLGDSRLYAFSSKGATCLTSDDVNSDGQITSYLDWRTGVVGEIAVQSFRASKSTFALAAMTDGFYRACSDAELLEFIGTCAKNLPLSNEVLTSWAKQFLGRNISDNVSLAVAFSANRTGGR